MVNLPNIKKTASKAFKVVSDLFFTVDDYAHTCAAISELSYRLENLTGIYYTNDRALGYEVRTTSGEVIATYNDYRGLYADLKARYAFATKGV